MFSSTTIARPRPHDAIPSAPPGTYLPKTEIQVNAHKVKILKYLSSGGFAHVYQVKMPKAISGTDIAVLKRVAVPDKEALANMRTEVETMKKLKGHGPIVTYYDSHASSLKGGGYEVFLLMECCDGGGLIDLMNNRLEFRLTEPEILKIFTDVAEGVACMHYLKPPLLHRDLKVENVLISGSGSSKRFKLCDFGSTAPPRPAGTTAAECRLISDDVQRHTTLQYRSPEMIDVYRKQAIDEKADIWALGVLLYKLCYYTTPFEKRQDDLRPDEDPDRYISLAILNASFEFPARPPYFSDRLRKLIVSMLKENPQARPNIYQVLREACSMQHIQVPIKDIYAGRTESEARRMQKLPEASVDSVSPPPVGAVYSPPDAMLKSALPDIIPMRRGRPPAHDAAVASKPSSSPSKGSRSDPFAALDKPSTKESTLPPIGLSDDVAERFPSLESFSLLHEKGKFSFGSDKTQTATKKDLKERIVEQLADDAFVQSSTSAKSFDTSPRTEATPSISSTSTHLRKSGATVPTLQASISAPPTRLHDTKPPRPSYVSTATMTSPPDSPIESASRKSKPPPIWRVPAQNDHLRSTSLPRTASPTSFSENKTSLRSQIAAQTVQDRNALSSRPSLESSWAEEFTKPLPESRANNSTRQRPSSTYVASNLDFLRGQEAEKEREKEKVPTRPTIFQRRSSTQHTPTLVNPNADDVSIPCNLEFLRSMEDQDESVKHERRRSSNESKNKRSSMPTISKSILAGKFGDAFKRFEANTSSSDDIPRTPSPLHELERRDLTPIAGSEAADVCSDDGNVLVDTELPPEQRRELERRRLSMEERRVIDAAAEYKRRLAEKDPRAKPSVNIIRASVIQDRMRNLQADAQKAPSTRTAEGYGKYTERDVASAPPTVSTSLPKADSTRKPALQPPTTVSRPARSVMLPPDLNSKKVRMPSTQSRTATQSPTAVQRPMTPNANTESRPPTAPKPTHLNKLVTTSQSSLKKQSGEDQSLTTGVRTPRRVTAHPDMTLEEKEEYMREFQKRFPSVSAV